MAAVTRFGAFAAGLVLLTSCAVTYPVATLTPSTPAGPRATAAAPATGSAQDALWADGDSPQVLDAELLGDLLVGVETRSTASPRLFASWPRFGQPRVDQPVSAYFSSSISDFENRYPNDPGQAELNLGWQLLASSPSAVGLASDSIALGEGPAENRWRSFWFDPTSGTPFTDDALLVDHRSTLAALRSVAATRDGVDLD